MVDAINQLVRPYVTALFATAMVILWYQGKISNELATNMVTMVVSFWFGQRAATLASTSPTPIAPVTPPALPSPAPDTTPPS